MAKNYGKPALILLAGAFLIWGIICFRTVEAQNGPGFENYPSGSSAQRSSAPLTDGQLNAAAPVTIPRPLEVPEVYVFDRVLNGGIMQVVLVDSERKRICVYHIDAQGQIEFVANRPYEWDLTVDGFNGTGLTPNQIREMQESGRRGAPE